MAQIIRKRTWGLITFVGCRLDPAAAAHIEGTGGTIIAPPIEADIDGSETA